MAVNYAEKFSQTIDEQLSKDSLTDKAVNKDYDFDGVNKVNVYSVETVPLNDYDINAKSNRYGTPVELGNDVQTLELTQDKSFTFSIDRKNATDTMMAMSAAKALARELKRGGNSYDRPLQDREIHGRSVSSTYQRGDTYHRNSIQCISGRLHGAV